MQSLPTRIAASPIYWARILQSALLCVIAVVMLGAGQSRYDRLGHQLMCSCSCGQILV
jgi:cytochrome c-type biogenesis protein CcmH